jgi:hypothetical protein
MLWPLSEQFNELFIARVMADRRRAFEADRSLIAKYPNVSVGYGRSSIPIFGAMLFILTRNNVLPLGLQK